MATEPVDFESNLRSKMRDIVREQNAEPVTEAAPAVEPVVETPAEPTPVQDPTPAVESTSPVEAAPAEVKAAEGSTPAVAPAEASDVPTTSARDTLAKRGLAFGDEKTAAEYLRVESELAARVRAEKEAKRAQPAIEAQPVATPAAPEPVPVQTPVAVAPVAPAVTPQSEPPIGGQAALPPEIERVIAQQVVEDSTCRAIADQYHKAEAELSSICIMDPTGSYPVGGKVAELNTQINELSRLIAGPNPALKAVGIDVPMLDEIQLGDAKRLLSDLKNDRRDLFDKYEATRERHERLREQFQTRANSFRTPYEQKVLESKAEADRSAEVDALANTFRDRWLAEQDAVLKAHNVPADLVDDLKDDMKIAAQAEVAMNGFIKAEDIPRLMAAVTAKALQKADKYHRAKSAEYAKTKIADVQTATPAPPAAVAVAPPAHIENPDWEKKLMAKKRLLLTQ